MQDTGPMSKDIYQRVRKRRVFYIPGYDPFPPRRYRELYRSESREQARISGYEIDQSPGKSAGRYGWNVTSQIDGVETEAEIEVLVWSDLVKGSMDQGIIATYSQLARTAWTYIASGALRRLTRLRKGPVIAALYPVGLLILQLFLALGLAGLAGWGLSWLSPWAAPLGLVIVPLLLNWFRKHDGRVFAWYLMHDYAHTAQGGGAYPPDLEARLAEFGDRIARALASDMDEVLVVGHSSGAHLAVSILSDLERAGRIPADGPALGLLSLGHVVPMVAFLPDAHRLRNDLNHLSQSDALAWVDITAPGDGCTFALCDPVAVTGVAGARKRWPLVVSAAFTQTLSPARWKELRWRFFRLHFQYLCAFDRPGDYDYFAITAGPQTLAARYEGRAPSKSRIEKPVSKFTSMVAA